MGHNIQAIIGESKIIKEISEEWIDALYVDLGQDISLIPLTGQLYDDIQELSNLKDMAWPYNEFSYLSKPVLELLKFKSFKRKIGYLETDYFGGTGTQSAILFEGQKVILGPFITETKWDNSIQVPIGERAINQILKSMGVKKKNCLDEFHAIGLMDLRSNEKIIEIYS